MSLPFVLPDKHLHLSMDAINQHSVYDQSSSGGTAKVEWIDFENKHWRCTVYNTDEDSQCGFHMYWSQSPYQNVDFSKYDILKLHLQYQGPTERIAIFLRNNDEGLVNLDESKVNSVYILSEDIKGSLEIRMSEFQVAEWWVEEYNVPRSEAYVQIDSIFSLELDFGNRVQLGVHEYSLKGIELIGQWIKPESMYLWVLLVWISSALVYVIANWIIQLRQTKLYREKLGRVRGEKDKFQLLSITDPLTGLLNRAGMEKEVLSILGTHNTLYGCCLIILDIDFFKNINDSLGHEVGDTVLVGLSKLVSNTLRKTDVLARWGGEEFVLLIPDNGKKENLVFSNKLREHISKYQFLNTKELTITASLGVAPFIQGETFEQCFKRADTALYKAKHSGRNRCEFADSI